MERERERSIMYCNNLPEDSEGQTKTQQYKHLVHLAKKSLQ